jgi:hypothetical protein
VLNSSSAIPDNIDTGSLGSLISGASAGSAQANPIGQLGQIAGQIPGAGNIIGSPASGAGLLGGNAGGLGSGQQGTNSGPGAPIVVTDITSGGSLAGQSIQSGLKNVADASQKDIQGGFSLRMSPRSCLWHVRPGPGLGHRDRVASRERFSERLVQVCILFGLLLRLDLGFLGHGNSSGSPFRNQPEIAVSGQDYPTVLIA